MTIPGDSFPRQTARTRNFTVGAPRTFRVAADGSRVVFLRSAAGDDPLNGLWLLDVATGEERLVTDARALLASGEEDLPEAEKARRERVREVGGGIVAYDTDPLCTVAVVAAGGRLFLVDLVDAGAGVSPLPSAAGAYDPRLTPAGDRIAYVSGRSLRIVDRDGNDRLLVEEAGPDVSWGSAEFVAAEEMGRARGHWWSPDGARLAVARVDVSSVERWFVTDPTNPAREPTTLRYPAAGTANALVSLAVIGVDGTRAAVAWDSDRFPYLVSVCWEDQGLLLGVQSRDQRELAVLVADPATGAVTTRLHQTDPVWVDIVEGTPGWLGGRVVTVEDGLLLDGAPVTPPGLHVRRVAYRDGATASALVTASEEDPTVVHVYRAGPGQPVDRLSSGGGVHEVVAAGGDVVVTSTQDMDRDGLLIRVWKGAEEAATVMSHAETPLVRPEVSFAVVGERRLRSAVLLPRDRAVEGPLPVLMDPYGGPHAQRVLRRRTGFLASQWLADQGFAVVVVDGRGTPGRGPAWDRAVHGDLAGPPLDDQIDALHALAERDERLDLARVAIRGWSFGGYLAALAVLRRPDVFHAAIAGAPVTDWTIYDTHYTERYLGLPAEAPEAYERSSILADAARLTRPLLLIHGLLDDNVVAAHSLRLSGALLEGGRPHRFLPLSAATHLARDERVAESLLRLQVEFLDEALGLNGSART